MREMDAEEDFNQRGGEFAGKVADFLYYVSEAVKTKHELDTVKLVYTGSTEPINVAPGIGKFGFSYSNFRTYNLEATMNSLVSNCPVLANGWGDDDAHSWVIDGYKYVTHQYRTYDGNGNLLENDMVNDYNYDLTYAYLHCNFGWEHATSNGDYTLSQVVEVHGWPSHTYVYSDIFRSTNRGIADNGVTPKTFAYTTVHIMCNIEYDGN